MLREICFLGKILSVDLTGGSKMLGVGERGSY